MKAMWPVQPGEERQQRALARARGPLEHHQGPGGDGEAHPVEPHHLGGAEAVDPGELPGMDDGRGVGPRVDEHGALGDPLFTPAGWSAYAGDLLERLPVSQPCMRFSRLPRSSQP